MSNCLLSWLSALAVSVLPFACGPNHQQALSDPAGGRSGAGGAGAMAGAGGSLVGGAGGVGGGTSAGGSTGCVGSAATAGTGAASSSGGSGGGGGAGGGPALFTPASACCASGNVQAAFAVCNNCHTQGHLDGYAPTLETFAQLSYRKGSIAAQLNGGKMPPPSSGRVLAPADKTTILNWVAAGALGVPHAQGICP